MHSEDNIKYEDSDTKILEDDMSNFSMSSFPSVLMDKKTQFIDTTGTGRMAMNGKSCVTRKEFDRGAISLFISALKAITMTKGGHKCNKIASSVLREYETRCKNTIFIPESDNHPIIPKKFKLPTNVELQSLSANNTDALTMSGEELTEL